MLQRRIAKDWVVKEPMQIAQILAEPNFYNIDGVLIFIDQKGARNSQSIKKPDFGF